MRKPTVPESSALMDEVRAIVASDGRSVQTAVAGANLTRMTWWKWTKGGHTPKQVAALEAVLGNYGYRLRLEKLPKTS